MLVNVKSESTVALAVITSWRIFANVDAVSVVSVALIDVCNHCEKGIVLVQITNFIRIKKKQKSKDAEWNTVNK